MLIFLRRGWGAPGWSAQQCLVCNKKYEIYVTGKTTVPLCCSGKCESELRGVPIKRITKPKMRNIKENKNA